MTASTNSPCFFASTPGGGARSRIGLGPLQERHALIDARQEAGGTERRAAARAARTGLQHDEARQAVAFAAEPVGEPRAHARPAELRAAGVDEALRRAVVEHVRLHAAKPAQFVGDRRGDAAGVR